MANAATAQNQADLSQGSLELRFGLMVQPGLHGGEDSGLGMQAHADDEGKSEFLPVALVPVLEPLVFLVVEPVESEDLRIQNQIFRVFVVGARADVGADFVQDGGDLGVSGHGVDGHQRAFELLRLGEVIEQHRDGGDLVGFLTDESLRQSDSRLAGPVRCNGFLDRLLFSFG